MIKKQIRYDLYQRTVTATVVSCINPCVRNFKIYPVIFHIDEILILLFFCYDLKFVIRLNSRQIVNACFSCWFYLLYLHD